MTDISSINLDKLRNIVQKFGAHSFTAAQVATEYEGSAASGETAKTFDELTGVLGLLYNRKKTDAIPAEVTALVEERAAAKKAKDWGRADAIRAQLTEMGWSVTDTAQGPKIAKL